MATTSTLGAGSTTMKADARASYTGDTLGDIQPGGPSFSKNWAAAGGTVPTQSGWLYGTIVVPAAGLTILLASASDPFGTGGDSVPMPAGFNPVGAKVKELFIRNKSLTVALEVARPANGLPIFKASGDARDLAACDAMHLYMEAGLAALVSGSNDAILLTAASATVDAEVFVRFGP